MRKYTVFILLLCLSYSAYTQENETRFEYSRFYHVKKEIQRSLEAIALEYANQPKTKKLQAEIAGVLTLLLQTKAKQYHFNFNVICDDRNNQKETVEAGMLIYTVNAKYKDAMGAIAWQFSAVMSKEAIQFFVNVEDGQPKEIKDLYNWGTMYRS